MNKLLTSRQVSIILFISVVSLKLLVFPALVTREAGRDAYVSIFLYLIIEFIFVLLVLLFMRRYPHISFREAISTTLGDITSKIVYFVLFVYFLFKTLFLIKETYQQ